MRLLGPTHSWEPAASDSGLSGAWWERTRSREVTRQSQPRDAGFSRTTPGPGLVIGGCDHLDADDVTRRQRLGVTHRQTPMKLLAPARPASWPTIVFGHRGAQAASAAAHPQPLLTLVQPDVEQRRHGSCLGGLGCGCAESCGHIKRRHGYRLVHRSNQGSRAPAFGPSRSDCGCDPRP